MSGMGNGEMGRMKENKGLPNKKIINRFGKTWERYCYLVYLPCSYLNAKIE